MAHANTAGASMSMCHKYSVAAAAEDLMAIKSHDTSKASCARKCMRAACAESVANGIPRDVEAKSHNAETTCRRRRGRAKRTVTDEHTIAMREHRIPTAYHRDSEAWDHRYDTMRTCDNNVPTCTLDHHRGTFTRSNASEFL